MKKIILSIVFVLSLATVPVFAGSSVVNISINGDLVEWTKNSGAPFVDSANRTQVPFRQTMETFGASVEWDKTTDTAIAKKDGITVEVPIGERYIFRNGVKITNDTAALIKTGRTYLPIRAVLEAFDAQVGWNNQTKTVLVTIDDDYYSGLSIKSPAPINSTMIQTSKNGSELRIKVTEVLRGAVAWRKIHEKNMFNDEPKEGMEYMLVKVNFELSKGDADVPYKPNRFDFDMFSEKGVKYEFTSVVLPEPHLSNTIFSGGSTEGYLAFMIDKEDNPVLAFDLNYDGTNGIWFRTDK